MKDPYASGVHVLGLGSGESAVQCWTLGGHNHLCGVPSYSGRGLPSVRNGGAAHGGWVLVGSGPFRSLSPLSHLPIWIVKPRAWQLHAGSVVLLQPLSGFVGVAGQYRGVLSKCACELGSPALSL